MPPRGATRNVKWPYYHIVIESLFAFFFKYRPVVFARGELGFAAPWPVALVLIAGLIAAALTIAAYARATRLAPRERWVLAGLRLGALAALAFALAAPVLLVAVVVPQQNFLAILLDDSGSMRIADAGEPRSTVQRRAFDPDSGAVTRALAGRFRLRFFRFSELAERISGGGALRYVGRRTDIAGALDHVQNDMAGVPLAGIVVVTDGADNAAAALEGPLERLRAARVPVYPVALGAERFTRDVEVQRAETPRTVLRGASLVTQVWIQARGFENRTVPLVVEDEGRIVASQQVRLPASGEPVAVRVAFAATEPGPHRFRFRVPVQEGEQLALNNALEALVVVEDRREKILYFEGEPRWEIKFLRRAVAGDANLHVVTLVRTARDKYLRLDVDDSTEVQAGFPRTRDELYRYRAIVLGSVEASAFTHDQLRMIADFVSRRGGGLLALGGRHAFGEGGYAETPVAEALPVVFTAQQRRDDAGVLAEVRARPASAGQTHPATQIRATPEASLAAWDSLPALTLVNRIERLKPGASLLLEGRDGSATLPLLAAQRYGRGLSLALLAQDVWHYRMGAGIPPGDRTHETLWRQLLRWLVSAVPEPVSVTLSSDRAESGRPVTISATVRDSSYLGVDGAAVVARVTDGAGAGHDVPLAWTGGGEGEYRGTFTPASDGLYRVDVAARRGATSLGGARTFLDVGDLRAEQFSAQRRTPLLRRIASETGGRFYTADAAGTLPEDVTLSESGVSVREQRDLWNMPIVFFVLLTFAGTEWLYRRRRGLA
jgi:uncharacterized membrane protein